MDGLGTYVGEGVTCLQLCIMLSALAELQREPHDTVHNPCECHHPHHTMKSQDSQRAQHFFEQPTTNNYKFSHTYA